MAAEVDVFKFLIGSQIEGTPIEFRQSHHTSIKLAMHLFKYVVIGHVSADSLIR